MTEAELVAALANLGNSKLHLDGRNVVCGLCQKMVQIPGERKRREKVMYFKRTHYRLCWKKLGNNSFEMVNFNEDGIHGYDDDERDCLEDVWTQHKLEREAKNTIDRGGSLHGRRKTELPSLDTIRSFLEALGGAVIVENGTKVQCGVCRNKFRVTAGRPIMGNLRYFEKTHLLRCKGRVGEGIIQELISDSFCERKVESKVRKSATPKWDNKRGNIVCSLLTGNSKLQSKCNTHLGFKKNCQIQMNPKSQNTFVSKRRQSLYAANVCFECMEHYDDITDHFLQKHPDLSEPFDYLACQSF